MGTGEEVRVAENEIRDVMLIYDAIEMVGLPELIDKPAKVRGRKPFNRQLLLSIIIYGLQKGWSYRQMEMFCEENLEELRKIDGTLRKAPDHSIFYLTAKELRVTDILRIVAKVKELKGEVPVLWY